MILVVAVVVALVAAGAIYSYLNSVQDRAYNNAKLVKVYRVDKDIAKGLPGEQAIDQEYVKSGDIPQQYRPTTALTDINAIRGKVALNNLSAGQIVVDGMFVDPRTATVSFAQRIPPGQVAVTIQVDNIRGVAGLIVPGDQVNIMAQAQDGQRYLFQNVNVLAVGNTPAPQPGDTTATTAQTTAGGGSGLMTFAVPPLAAAKISVASGVYLTLVPPGNQPVAVPPVNPQNLFQGPLTPYA
ncbi:MAG: Flp pilus assembly protein CpaB [Acidimicrobiia bacterium]|nr:Flp pilus assembly protein CpaB [Acidimicrobiia bacterium]